METIEEQFLAYQAVLDWMDIFALAFAVFFISDCLFDFCFKRRPGWKETFANGFIFLVNAGLDILGFGLLFILGLIVFEPLAFFEIPKSWWYWPLTLLAADLSYYWMHRLEHEIRLFWAVHVVHHSSPEFNTSTAFRLSWVESLYEWIFLVPMILLGFGVVETLIATLIVIQYQSWIHTEKVGRLGFLDKIFNTPSAHRVHHGSTPDCIDKNYGGILMLWDHLFGTYQSEPEKNIYGITTPLGTSNPFTINFAEFAAIGRDVIRLKGLKNKLLALFGRPGATEVQKESNQ